MSNILEIADFNDQQLDVYARLTENQLLNRHEPDKGIFIAESPKVIERALNAGCVPVSILMEKKHIEGEGREILARCTNIPVFTAEFDVLTQLTGFKLTRGMLCAMRRPKLPSAADVCKNCRIRKYYEPDKYWCYFPFRCGIEYRCGTFNRRLQQSTLPACYPRKHGNCIPDSMDLSQCR